MSLWFRDCDNPDLEDGEVIVEEINVCDECGDVGPVYLCGASVRCHRCAGLYEEQNHG